MMTCKRCSDREHLMYSEVDGKIVEHKTIHPPLHMQPRFVIGVLEQVKEGTTDVWTAARALELPCPDEKEWKEMLRALNIANKVAHVLIREEIRPSILRSKPVTFRARRWWNRLLIPFRKEVA